LIPTGLDVTRSPVRPDAVTVRVAACAGGITVNAAVRVMLSCVVAIVTEVDAATLDVVAVNVAVVAPAATVTLAGTVATAVLLLESETMRPPAGAALESATVPVELTPPVTLAGFMLTACRLAAAGGVTVRVVVLVTPPWVPLIETGVSAATDEVVAANVALVAPAAMVMLAGTATVPGLLLESDTTAPAVGAPAVNITVPVDPVPPTTDEGFTEMDDSAAGPDAASGVKRRVDENGPNAPAAFRARTRHHRRCAGRPLTTACDTVTVGFASNGAEMVDVLSTWTS
jgi:hypothetical protein